MIHTNNPNAKILIVSSWYCFRGEGLDLNDLSFEIDKFMLIKDIFKKDCIIFAKTYDFFTRICKRDEYELLRFLPRKNINNVMISKIDAILLSS